MSFPLKGLSPAEVIEGYELACKKGLETLPGSNYCNLVLYILSTDCLDLKIQ